MDQISLNKIRATAEALASHWTDVLDPANTELDWALHVMYDIDRGASGLTWPEGGQISNAAANRDVGSGLDGMTFAQYRDTVLDRVQAIRGVAEARAQACAERDWAVLQAAHGVRGYLAPRLAPQPRKRAPKSPSR